MTLGWGEVDDRIERMLLRFPEFQALPQPGPGPQLRIYGVPRGGAIVAGLMFSKLPKVFTIVDHPEQAQYIVDDIIDSGKTRARFAAIGVPFIALIDKLGDDRGVGWVQFPWEARDPTADMEDTVVRQLQFIGEDATREGLRDTPKRYIKAFSEMTSGVRLDPKEPLKKVFEENHDEIVCVTDVGFVSLCEHHLLPFTGTVDFAYLPKGKIVGLSKIPRFIQILARRPQVQERLTSQIVDMFAEEVSPAGVMAVVRGQHSCMKYRGVQSSGEMVTSAVRGVFKDKPEARAEALALFAK
jgi:GTP cyclohydrolase I